VDLQELAALLEDVVPKLRSVGVTRVSLDPSGRFDVDIAPPTPSPAIVDLDALVGPQLSDVAAKDIDATLCVVCGVRPRRYGDHCRVCTRAEVNSAS
jgi:hypothetical protein